MKKILAVLLALAMVFTLAACGGEKTEEAKATKFYVLGPTPDHGWTAQAGAYAQQKCEEITKAGKYEAVFMPAKSGDEQCDICNTVIANGDAALVVIQALDDSAKAGVDALIEAEIPFIEFDRFIMEDMDKAVLNYSGNNYDCGAGIAYWLQKNGLEPGATLVELMGDNGSVCVYRQQGFEEFLQGKRDYNDNFTGESYHTAKEWTADEVAALFQYQTVCNWSADGAVSYLEPKLDEIVAAAKANNGKLFIFSEDDEMTFGVMTVLEGANEATLADLEGLEVYISAIGGMQELYDVMLGKADKSAVAAKYFDDMMSVSFNPSMMKSAIDYAVKYLDGDWNFALGEEATEPVFIVDANNAAQFEGFTGH